MSEPSRSHSSGSPGSTSTSGDSTGNGRFGRWWVWAIVVVAALAIAGYAARWGFSGDPGDPAKGPVVAVRRGPLLISITESGEVEAAERKIIRNELPWAAIIKEVVEEGDVVAEGEVIIKFECKELTDAIEKSRMDLNTAEKDHTGAKSDLELKKQEVANSLRKAAQAVKDAEENLQRYIEGEWPIRKDEAESEIQLAQRDLALARSTLEAKQKINADPELDSPYSDSEMEAEKLAVERLKLALEKAVSSRDMLIKYDHPRQLRTLEMGVEDAKLDQKRAQHTATSEMAAAEADESAAAAMLRMEQERLEDLLADAENLLVKAEKSGLVVYDTARRRFGGEEVLVAVGEKINPRQQLMIIPDMGTLQVRTRVYEALIDQINQGLESQQGIDAFIRLDSMPDRVLKGTVSWVAPLPDRGNWFTPDVKFFNVLVQFQDPVEGLGLKPNMTAKVELVLARLENVLSVPVAAVFTEQEKHFCWKVAGGQARKIEVTVGRSNEKRVQVLSGLQEDDKVRLVAPEEAAAAKAKREGERPPGPPAGKGTRKKT